MTLPEPFVDLATVPELRTILDRGLLSKVRIFEAWCEQGDRLFQVVKIRGRPLAFARIRRDSITLSPNPAFHGQRRLGHRKDRQAMWLDLHWKLYYVPFEPPAAGESKQIYPIRLSAQCQHERLSVPADWLREQVRAGVAKRIITNATRFEMGTRYRGE
jgi:hypothetical protein